MLVGSYDEGVWWSQARGETESFTALLKRKQLRTLNQFQAVITVSKTDSPFAFERAECSRSIEILRAVPPAVLGKIVQHPSMIYWTSACEYLLRAELGLISNPTQWAKHLPFGKPDLQTHLCDLTRFAIAAALRAGHTFEIRWTPLHCGRISLPGSGLYLDSDALEGPICTNLDGGQFEPMPKIQASNSQIEIDPWDFNLKFGWAQTEQFPGGLSANVIPDDEIPKVRSILMTAMDLLITAHPLIEREIALALKCVVPLSSPNADVNISVSAPEFFGAIMFSLDPAPMIMEVLIHEYRHNILHLLNEEVSFFEDNVAAPKLLYSPWRPDPRPPIGLLHALFTFSEVVRGYQSLLRSDKLSPTNRRSAARRCVGHTLRLQIGLDEFSKVEGLTPFGRGLLDGLADSIGSSADSARSIQVDAHDVIGSVHAHRQMHRSDNQSLLTP